MGHASLGIINKWLIGIKDVYRLHRDEIDALPPGQAREDRLVEWNVREQMMNLTKTSIIQRAWGEHSRPWLHAWVYRLDDGVLHELQSMAPQSEIDPLYRFDWRTG